MDENTTKTTIQDDVFKNTFLKKSRMHNSKARGCLGAIAEIEGWHCAISIPDEEGKSKFDVFETREDARKFLDTIGLN